MNESIRYTRRRDLEEQMMAISYDLARETDPESREILRDAYRAARNRADALDAPEQ